MRKMLLAGGMLVALAMPAIANTEVSDETGQAACNGDFPFLAKQGWFYTRSANHSRSQQPDATEAAAVEEQHKQKATELCEEYQAQQKARDDYVPQFATVPGYEWHLISHDTHGFGVQWVTQHTPFPGYGGYTVDTIPQETHVSVAKGAICLIPEGTFHPEEIEMKVEFLGGQHLTIPVAAIDPKVLECKIDKSDAAFKLFHQTLIQCDDQ